MIEEVIINSVRAEAYVPSLIFNWIITLVSWLVLTLSLKSKKADMGKFWLIFGLTVIISGIIVMFSIIAPEWITITIKYLKDFLN